MTRIRGIQPRLPIAGRIRLGTKDEARGFPRASDHFIVPDEVKAALGNTKLTSLNIVFPSDDEGYVARSGYEYYQQSLGYICTGDGEYAERVSDTSVPVLTDGTPTPISAKTPKEHVNRISGVTCAGRDCLFAKDKKCKPVLHLSFVLPDVPESFGVYVINTSSMKSIRNIYAALDLTRHLAGRIDGIPFRLSLVAEQAKNPQTQRMQTVYRLDMRPVQGHGELITLRKREGLNPGPAQMALPEPDEDDEEYLRAEFSEITATDVLTEVAEEQRRTSHLLDEALTQGGELTDYQLNKPTDISDIIFRQRIGVPLSGEASTALDHLATPATGSDTDILAAKLAREDLPGNEQLFPYVKQLSNNKTGFDPVRFWQDAEKFSDKQSVFSLIGTEAITDWLRKDRKRSLRGLLAALRDIYTQSQAGVA